MPILVVDFLQAVEVEKQYGETAAGAPRALNFGFEHFDQAPVIGEARERIRSSHVADLIEELRVIEKRAAENDHVARDHHEVREGVRGIEVMLRFAHGDVTDDVESCRDE